MDEHEQSHTALSRALPASSARRTRVLRYPLKRCTSTSDRVGQAIRYLRLLLPSLLHWRETVDAGPVGPSASKSGSRYPVLSALGERTLDGPVGRSGREAGLAARSGPRPGERPGLFP